ncbi:MAG TPA: transketolase C-terminal domain-containing protein [Anaerolineales bacterium]|nr:transketolase C-terminal domain-containing protein [Anaerolineales bacterium]
MATEVQALARADLALDWAEVTRLVLRSRALDELEERELAPTGEVPYQFSSRGHELAQVLLAIHLNHPHDAAGVYYRSRPFMLAAGLTPAEALAAGMGRTGSPSEGRDVGVVFSLPPRRGPTVLPASGDVGAQYTPVAGWAQAIRYRQQVMGEGSWQGAIAVALGGDGSVATNGFWSALTIASTLRLPMLFFVEDNGFGLSVRGGLQTPGGDIAANLASFGGLRVVSGSGTDPEITAELVSASVSHVRSGEGPCLLRLTVPRLGGHTFIDNQAYKTAAEREQEAGQDPLLALERLMGRPVFEELKSDIEVDVQEALLEARARPAPPASTAHRHLFFDGGPQTVGGMSPELGSRPLATINPPIVNGPRLNLIDAVRSVLEEELSRNPRALVFGEDVGAKGGVHGATLGLQARFGEGRVFDTSLSEEGIVGRAVGMALAGLLPIPEIQFRKYADPATEQINDCGTIRWRTAGRFAAPLVLRIPVGYGKRTGDPWHSVTGEAVFAHTLGWRIAFPSNAADAVGLLRSALRGEDPSFFLEHRALLDAPQARRPDPGADYLVPFGKAATLLVGDEATVVTWGAMVYACLEAAERFRGRIELIDLRTIIPWDQQAVIASVRKTGRCLVVHEDTSTAGFGGEILATLAEQCFRDLDAPLRRLSVPDCPIPYSADLMRAVLPNAESIGVAIADLLGF